MRIEGFWAEGLRLCQTSRDPAARILRAMSEAPVVMGRILEGSLGWS
jgi:hypothetical protein